MADTTAAEQKVLNALESAITDIQSNSTHPNDAIYKVATDQKIGPEFVKRMCEAYNTSKTLSFMKSAQGKDRAGTFPLADPVDVLERMYPKLDTLQKAASVQVDSTDYDRVVDLRKTASPVVPPLVEKKPDAYQAVNECRKERIKVSHLHRDMTQKTSEHREAKKQIVKLIKSAGEYFRYDHDLSFADIETDIAGTFGDKVRPIMSMVHSTLPNKTEKRGEYDTRPRLFDTTKAPYLQIVTAIDKAARLLELESEIVQTEDLLKAATKALSEKRGPASNEKQAGVISSVLGSTIASRMGGPKAVDALIPPSRTPAEREADISEKYLTTLDPEHEAALKAIRAEANLNDLLVNDEVISGYPEDRVTALYNQLAEAAPRATEQRLLLQSYLRRMLQQSDAQEPYETKQLLEEETALAKAQTPESILPA